MEKELEQFSSFSVLINHIVERYLQNVYCIAILWSIAPAMYDGLPGIDYGQIREVVDDKELRYNQFVWINIENESLESLERLIGDTVNLGCQAWLVSNEGVEAFLNIYGNVVDTTTKQRPQKVHMIFSMDQPTDDPIKTSREIFSHRTLEDVPNVLLIIPSTASTTSSALSLDDGKSFDLVTSSFVGRFNNTQPIFLDKFSVSSQNFTTATHLFPDKLNNLQQRHLRLSLFNYKPYSTVQHVAPGMGNANAMTTEDELTLLIDGTESLMMLEFCARHNCTLLISEDEEGQWGVIYENRTGNGLTGAVVERRAEVSIGAIYLWYYESQFLSLSTIISRTGITCIVPRPALLPGWLTPVLPFSTILWVAVLVSLFVGIIILRFIDKYRNSTVVHSSGSSHSFVESVITVIGIYVLQPTKFLDSQLGERVLFGSLLVTGWFIGNIYGSGLSSVMTVPQYLAPIDTPTQLAASNMEWSATHDAWIFSIQSATQPLLVALVQNFHIRNHDELRSHSKRADIGFSIERLQYGHFAIGEYIQEDILDRYQIMLEDIYWEYCVAMSYRTWSMMPSFDLLVMQVAESGIQKYWELMVVQRHLNNKVQLGVSQSRHHDNRGPVSLTPSHLLGLFSVWGFGLILATIVFIIEISLGAHNLKM